MLSRELSDCRRVVGLSLGLHHYKRGNGYSSYNMTFMIEM